jgi:archaetidylinositol phosphate synthase
MAGAETGDLCRSGAAAPVAGDTVIGGSWTHLLARRMVTPLLGSFVTPNHLTTLRLVSGLAACYGFALGTTAGTWWGGGLWLVSAFLDRADGELARIGNLSSKRGHLYDYCTDILVNVIFFVSIGVGQRQSWLGHWAPVLGLVAGVSLLLCIWWSERLEQLGPPGARAYSGFWGFDPDDALYLMTPFAWLGWLGWVLVGAAAATPLVAAVTGARLLALRPAQRGGAPPVGDLVGGLPPPG